MKNDQPHKRKTGDKAPIKKNGSGGVDFLRQNIVVYRNSFLQECLVGSRRNTEESIRTRAAQLELSLPGPAFCVVLFAAYMQDRPADTVDSSMAQMEQIVRDCISPRFFCCTLPDAYNNIVTILSVEGESVISELEALSEQVAKRVLDELNLRIFAGVGSVVEKFSEISRSNAAAGDALSYRYSFSSGQVVLYQNVSFFYRQNTREYRMLTERVLGCFYDGNLTMMRVRMEDLLRYVQDTDVKVPENMRIICMELLSSILLRADEMIRENTADERALLEELEALSTPEGMIDWFLSQSEKLLNRMAESHSSRNRQILRLAEEYIETNLGNQGISVQSISNYLQLSPSYFSSIFLKEKGMHISEYINKKRVAAAGELLRNTNQKISSIGAQTGFSSPNYFNHVFKKYMGMTPGHYRNWDGQLEDRDDQLSDEY